jgi:hypothetical protein
MKSYLYAIVLSFLYFFVSTSHADIDIKKCQPNQNGHVIFNDDDDKIAKKIIDYKLHDQSEKHEYIIIKIFANENHDDRNDWIASFLFDDKFEQYLLYQVDQNQFIDIDEKQFDALSSKIIECNQDKQTPIYRKVLP